MQQICDILLCSDYIVTQDKERRILENAALAIHDGIVIALDSKETLQKHFTPTQHIDKPQTLIMPGLVNTHTHVSMTFLRGLSDDLALMDWLNKHIFPVEAHLTPELVMFSSLLGYAEMLRTGTTACMDVYIFEDAVLHAADRSGIRCMGGEAIFNFPSAACPHSRDAFMRTRQLAERYHKHPRLSVCAAPHSVYTTTPEILEQSVALADELNLPLHIHLAESETETLTSLKQHGKRPIPYCHDLGLLRPGTTLAHVVDISPEELDILAQTGAYVAHNPSSNMKLASGIAPVIAMQERGIPVGLGTDGAASNNRLNMFTEMGRAALLHKVHSLDPTALPAQTVLDMGTRDGAKIFGKPELGSLTVGAPADLAMLRLSEPNMQPLYTPTSQLVYAATGMEVCLTMVAGEILYQDGIFTRFDYEEILRQAQEKRAWVQKKQA